MKRSVYIWLPFLKRTLSTLLSLKSGRNNQSFRNFPALVYDPNKLKLKLFDCQFCCYNRARKLLSLLPLLEGACVITIHLYKQSICIRFYLQRGRFRNIHLHLKACLYKYIIQKFSCKKRFHNKNLNQFLDLKREQICRRNKSVPFPNRIQLIDEVNSAVYKDTRQSIIPDGNVLSKHTRIKQYDLFYLSESCILSVCLLCV